MIIPTRNRDNELRRCLERLQPAVQALGEEKYEVIVTDDGDSSVSSTRLMLSSSFPWARWTPGPRRGPAANRNHGACLAEGEWLVFVDDDCIPSDVLLKAYLAALHDAPVLEGKTTSTDMPSFSPRHEAPVNLTGGCLFSCNLCIRKQFFMQLGGFDERFRFWCEDMDFKRRLAVSGQRSVFVADALVDHPCRLRPIGFAMGRRWYGIVDLWSSEQRRLTWCDVVSHVAKIRIGEVLRMRPSVTNAVLAMSMIPELWIVCLSANRWIATSRKIFESGRWPLDPKQTKA